MDDHQEWQNYAEKHQCHTEAEKETRGINHSFSNRQGGKVREEKLLNLRALSGFAVNILIQPARHKVARLGLEIGRGFFVAETSYEAGTAWMESTAGRRVDQARRLAGRHFLERLRVARIGIGGCREQRMSVGM